MSDVTNLDAKRDEKKTTLERIRDVFDDEAKAGEGVIGIAVYGYTDAEGDQRFGVATGGLAPTSNYLGLMEMAAFHLYHEAQGDE